MFQYGFFALLLVPFSLAGLLIILWNYMRKGT